MKVSQLAEELKVPASAVLDQCQRFGIAASWAGAELSRSDVIVLRAELVRDMAASGSSLDETSDEPPTAGASNALPPTAAGSLLELFEGSTGGDDPATGQPGEAAGGFTFAGTVHSDAGSAGSAAPLRPSDAATTASRNRHFDRGLSTALLAFGVTAALVAGSNFLLHNPWPIAVAWLGAGIALVGGTFRAAQARYRASTHPERIRGTVIATILTGIGVAAIVVASLAVWTIVRATSAEKAPLGLGRPSAVHELRWGWARLTLTAHNGWDPAAKDPGTCWENKAERDSNNIEPRRSDRTELGNSSTSCFGPHVYEVFDRWSVDHNRDTPYPGAEAIQATAIMRCTKQLDRLNHGAAGDPSADATLGFEYPLVDAWNRGDHDLTCVAQTSSRSTRLRE